MIKLNNIKGLNFEEIPIDEYWNSGYEKEMKMHRIHSYPAKFPAFITTKAIQYYEDLVGIRPEVIGDMFCGCGTTAFESSRNGIDFWGCDINPVATLIAKVKSTRYQTSELIKYKDYIINLYNERSKDDYYDVAPERLKFWYAQGQYNDLYCLRQVIYDILPKESKYLDFYLCAFSNILKTTSRWLTKSIKPQIDPHKQTFEVIASFSRQVESMITANKELDDCDLDTRSNTNIMTGNFLKNDWIIPAVNLVVSSPPYVTSYEYADLHQLSTLWLGYVDDYRDLRDGTIGSLYNDFNFNKELKRLNDSGYNIVARLLDQHKSKAKAVAKYFLDMQQVAIKTHALLSDGGAALFVIGNTEYKKVRINNALHLVEALKEAGFSNIYITKRKITRKILTPYRDDTGKFSKLETGKKIYTEEFIVMGRK